MSPRVIPDNGIKTFPATPGDGDATLVDRYIAGQVSYMRSQCTAPNPYTPTCSHSWFGDKLAVFDARKRMEAAIESPILQGRPQGDPDNPSADAGLEEASERLRVAAVMGRRELRDLTTGAGSGAGFVPAGGPPLYVAEEFALAARGRATLASALRQRPLPDVGMKIEVPRLSTGAAAEVQATENAAIQETDPVTAAASSNIATVAGQVDVSRQLFDLSQPGIDEVLAADLGAAVAEKVEAQLVAGTNLNGQTAGLVGASGVTVAYTDATPTPDELVSKIWQAYREIAEAGAGPSEPSPANYLIVMAPRRLAWLSADAGNAGGELPPLPGRPVATTGIRLALGASTSEDEIYVIASPEVFVSIGNTNIGIFEEIGSDTLTVRVRAFAYVGTMFVRQPNAVARISGTGLVAPTL